MKFKFSRIYNKDINIDMDYEKIKRKTQKKIKKLKMDISRRLIISKILYDENYKLIKRYLHNIIDNYIDIYGILYSLYNRSKLEKNILYNNTHLYKYINEIFRDMIHVNNKINIIKKHINKDYINKYIRDNNITNKKKFVYLIDKINDLLSINNYINRLYIVLDNILNIITFNIRENNIIKINDDNLNFIIYNFIINNNINEKIKKENIKISYVYEIHNFKHSNYKYKILNSYNKYTSYETFSDYIDNDINNMNDDISFLPKENTKNIYDKPKPKHNKVIKNIFSNGCDDLNIKNMENYISKLNNENNIYKQSNIDEHNINIININNYYRHKSNYYIDNDKYHINNDVSHSPLNDIDDYYINNILDIYMKYNKNNNVINDNIIKTIYNISSNNIKTSISEFLSTNFINDDNIKFINTNDNHTPKIQNHYILLNMFDYIILNNQDNDIINFIYKYYIYVIKYKLVKLLYNTTNIILDIK